MSTDETYRALVQFIHALGLPDEDRESLEQLAQAHAPQPGAGRMGSTENLENSDELPLLDDTVLGDSLWNPPVSPPWKRYEDLGFIGRGGMGEVRRVRDRILGRVLAMKFLAPQARRTIRARERFLAEARLTACLQHPGIVPVHDCGALEDGRLWFTMPEVRGRTLGAAIAVLHADRRNSPAPELLRRLLDAYARTCEVVAYAHGHGVLHRDLKPDNVMLGEFGEVFVMDWGIARTYPRDGGEVPGETALPALKRHTQAGQILGTPAYMSPEQARGAQDQLGPASDVYALGAILYELLCGSPPFAGVAAAVRVQVLHGPPPPLASRCRGKVPPDLLAICERAMARAPADRYPDARALAEDVHAFLDGARRRERARTLVTEARALEPEIASLRSRARQLRAQAEAMLARLEPFAPAEEKAAGWAREDEARALELTAATSEVAWRQKLRAALNETPDLDEAHEALADGYFAELRAAEEARDEEAAARAETLLSMHDRGRYAAFLRGEGALTLITEPEGAEVWLFRYTERQRRLALEPQGLLGRTPLRAESLARGSYLLVIRAPGYRDVRYPVRIGRNEHWMGVRPGAREPFPVLLLPEQSLEPDDVYVPAGWFLSGGDPLASESLPRRHVWVDGFVLRRHPITQTEYLAFLNALVDSGRGDEAEATCPRAARAVAGSSEVLLFLYARDRLGRFMPAPDAPPAHARHPVASVDWRAAAAYASWWASRTGHPWRLAGELEREKAARGVDGRVFPWGAQPEPTWACMVSSRPGPASPAPVDDYPVDESPYGVRGLAGNVRDWCAEVWLPHGPAVADGLAQVTPAAPGDGELRAIRGGAWSAAPPAMCRSAGRFAARPDELFRAVGFRLARPVGPPLDRS